jgi:hypothetical protein
VDVVFNQVEDLVEYGEMANYTYTMAQTISIAYSILNRTTKFSKSIKTWNHLPALQETWIAFKIHFRAHNELQETGELTMADAGYNLANLIEAIAKKVAELQIAPAIEPAHDPILPTIIAHMQQMQQLMAAMQTGYQQPTLPMTTTQQQPAQSQ